MKTFETAIKGLNLKMGGLLTFKYLETLQDSKGIFSDSPNSGTYDISKKTIVKQLNDKNLDLIICEGVKTAIRLEIAVLEWELYDKKYGLLGQYLNLLSREGCLVSKEFDFKKTSKTYDKNDQKYIDDINQYY